MGMLKFSRALFAVIAAFVAVSSSSSSSILFIAGQQQTTVNSNDTVTTTDTELVEEERPVIPDFQPVATKYPSDPNDWKSCTVDSDCAGGGGDGDGDDNDDDYFCLSHMWEYQQQSNSGRGCWSSTICSGSAAYENPLLPGWKLQFWCTGQQASTVAAVNVAPFGFTYGTRSIALDFRTVCTEDSDCPYHDDPQYNQQCLAVFYDATKDGLNYSNIVSCQNWEADKLPCPGPNFAKQNMNYEQTNRFSYYEEFSCTIPEEATDEAVVVVSDPTESTDSAEAAASDTAAVASGDDVDTGPTGTASDSSGNPISSSVVLITIGTVLFLTTLSTNASV